MLGRLLNRLLRRFGYELTPYSPAMAGFEETHLQTISRVCGLDGQPPMTMTGPARVSALIDAVEYVTEHKVPGALVECGVWRGGSMVAVAETLQRLKVSDRSLFLFDTFEGMPPPQAVDVDLRGASAEQLLQESDRETSNVWAVGSLPDVQRNLWATNYPRDKVVFVKGLVEETIPKHAPESIAILRLDTDWYESTRHELIHLFPRLSSGGVLIIDDYGHWAGAKKAVDEYIAEFGLRLLMHRIDYTGRVAIKQG